MFQDIKNSAETNAGFLASSPHIGIELSVNILTAGNWPAQMGTCFLPPQLRKCCDEFQKFYLSGHNGRKMIWMSNLGNGEVSAIYDGRKYELFVNTYQICILLLFNSRDTMTLSEIQHATGINPTELKRNLVSMIGSKTRLLMKDPDTKKVLNDEDRYTFHDQFKGKTFRIQVNVVGAEPESQANTQAANQKAESERQHQIDGAIVRSMKGARTMLEEALIDEVKNQITSFRPDVEVIKRRVEQLIEREYVSRKDGDILTWLG